MGKEDEVMFKKSIPKRRIPGTLALGSTNVIAGLYVFNIEDGGPDIIARYLGKFVPIDLWGVIALFSGVLLLLATIYRRWDIFNVAAALSLFFWGVVVFAIFATWFSGNRDSLSSVALAMAWWALSGQVAMLIAPLIKTWEEDPL